jgi:thiosulfate reductase cytochrome b subunit
MLDRPKQTPGVVIVVNSGLLTWSQMRLKFCDGHRGVRNKARITHATKAQCLPVCMHRSLVFEGPGSRWVLHRFLRYVRSPEIRSDPGRDSAS